jgi:hypothetical protein
MSVKSYRQQRQNIPCSELAEHRERWVAFSRDGSRIIASAPTLDELEARLAAMAGRKGQPEVVFEFLGADEPLIGGAELQ